MERTASRLDTLTIQVLSPDKQIRVTLRGDDDLSLAFAPGSYRQYREPALRQQLTTLATGVWTGYRRAYLQVMGIAPEERGATAGPGAKADRQRQAFAEARSRIVATGRSRNGAVYAESASLVRWSFHIEPGTVVRCSEAEFCRELIEAVRAVLADHRAKIIALKDEYFGLRLPDRRRRVPPQTG